MVRPPSDPPENDDTSNPTRTIMCRFGLIADIQYADIPDGVSFRRNPRYYRNALQAATSAVSHLVSHDVDCIWNLGDLLDAKISSSSSPENALDCILRDAFSLTVASSTTTSIHHIYGNHEIELFDRTHLQTKLHIPFAVEEDDGELVGYYSMVYGDVRFIAIDTYDICTQRRSGNKLQQAIALLDAHNPNDNKKSPASLEGAARRYVSMGGGLGVRQLQWLQQTLELAQNHHEMVVIFSHQPLSLESVQEANLPASLAWNYKEIQTVLNKYAGVVACCFSGHAHRYGYARDTTSGIHYRVLEAVLESQQPTYAVVEIYEGVMTIQGYGDCKSERYSLDHLTCRRKKKRKGNQVG